MAARIGKPRAGKPTQVKNKAPAPVQITAEQILREAMERVEAEPKPPRSKITDPEELEEYRRTKRKGYEDALRRNRLNIGAWLKYASWEANQKEFDRARSVFERALEVDYTNRTLWLKYAEMEMINKFVNTARNVWDRAISLLPREDQFWYKYAYMEEMLGNIGNARQIFERWLEWHPEPKAWHAYIKMEMRHQNMEQARHIYERFVIEHNEVDSYLKFAKWEEKIGQKLLARNIYERAITEMGEEANNEKLFIAFAKYEESLKEYERARTIYKHALDHLPKNRAEELYTKYVAFEKQFGDKAMVEDVIIAKRRFQYEEDVKKNPHNYDAWFDYIRLEESAGKTERIREVYERAVANVPPLKEKRYWKRYIYLWINYAVFEELVTKDMERTRQVYQKCIELVPHSDFTFAKVWLLYAQFEIRQQNLDQARKLLGTALGKCPKEKLFKGYIELESQLGSIDRCRKLYENYLKFLPSNCYAWTKYAELEASLAEFDRARKLYELGIAQPVLDMPEVLWKAYIDFEIAQKDYDRARALYRRLLERTKHYRVWVSCAQFETSINQPQRARDVFKQAEQYYKEGDAPKEERVQLLEAWLDFERNFGTEGDYQAIKKKMPKRVKKKRPILTESGEEAGTEEYYDYIFPDETSKMSTLAILEHARKWKKQKTQATEVDS